MFCEFIDKYKKSCELLRESLLKVKTEVDDSFVEIDNDFVIDDNFIWDDRKYVVFEVENSTEKENTLCNSSEIMEKLKPTPGLAQVELEKSKRKESKTTIRKTKNNQKISGGLELNRDKQQGTTKTSKVKKKQPKILNSKIQNHTKNLVEVEEGPLIPKTAEQKNNSVLCDYCGAVFKHKNHLKHHIDDRHVNTPVTCSICSKTYTSEERLKRHIRRYHGEKKLQCEQCPATFTKMSILNVHVKRVHNKNLFPKKKFSCKFCSKKYSGYYCYLAHERAVHTGLRPAVCNVCGKAFYHDVYLREHMRIHTGELPYKCPFCDRACTILGNLKSHLRTHKKSELNDKLMSKMKPGYFKYLKNC